MVFSLEILKRALSEGFLHQILSESDNKYENYKFKFFTPPIKVRLLLCLFSERTNPEEVFSYSEWYPNLNLTV
jgi:hypothetical protein